MAFLKKRDRGDFIDVFMHAFVYFEKDGAEEQAENSERTKYLYLKQGRPSLQSFHMKRNWELSSTAAALLISSTTQCFLMCKVISF